jgi:hypothetical protein
MRSPGMNFTTDRRTNFVRVARSRIHALVEAHKRALRIKLNERSEKGNGERIDYPFAISLPLPISRFQIPD